MNGRTGFLLAPLAVLTLLAVRGEVLTSFQRDFIAQPETVRRVRFADSAFRRELAKRPKQPSLHVVPSADAEAPIVILDPTVPNVRDFGGWRTADGRRIRRGRIFRTAGLNSNARDRKPTPADLAAADPEGALGSVREPVARLAARYAALTNDLSAMRIVRCEVPKAWLRLNLAEGLTALEAAVKLARGLPTEGGEELVVQNGCVTVGSLGPGKWAALSGTLTAEDEGFAVVRCAADWYWALAVNGVPVCDYLDGNRGSPAETQHEITIPVRRGENALTAIVGAGSSDYAFWLRSGTGGAKDGLVRREIDRLSALPETLRGHACGYEKGESRITDANRAFWLETLGIRSDIDLRSDRECRGMDGSPLGPTVAWHHVSSNAYGGMQSEEGRRAFARVFRVFLYEKNYPIVFHCIAGQDRTGAVAYILGALLGMSEDDLALDWELSGLANRDAKGFVHAMRYDGLVDGFKASFPGRTVCERAEAYVQSLGFTAEDIERFRSMMLEQGSEGPLDYVDPLIGTEGVGSEYGGMMPMTGVPFGSFQAVAMTRTNRIGRTSFNALDEKLLGVILTRQPAIWMGDWGEVRIPLKEPSKIVSSDYRPHCTKVVTEKGAVEFTASEHAAWIRFSGLCTDAFGGSGFSTNRMDARLGYPLPNFKGWYYVERPTDRNLRIGLSLISLEQAKRNLEAEMPSGDSFEAVMARTRGKWENQLGRVKVEAPDEVKRIFYTGLYHCSLYPRRIDEEGRYYSAFDDKVHEGRMYTSFSLWDTYRAEHPLLILLNPERVGDMMQSLLRMYQEGGWLPKWPNPSYTGIMTGAPAEIVLAEAMAKGVKGFDYALAREAIRKNATVPQKFDETRRWEDRGRFGREPETRAGLTSYLKRGYVACDQTAESVSRTLDFSFADRNRNYTNHWNATARRFLPRKANGDWDVPTRGAYTECNADTALWCVPHDVEGLVSLLGGPAEFERELDRYFDKLFFKPNAQGSSFHGNEPTHHTAYLYNRIGRPEKTQRRVRDILTRCYSSNRRGFDGNEDCGAMSAWYVFSTLGFYPLDPVSGEYEVGSPLVQSARIGNLEIRVKGPVPSSGSVEQVLFNGRCLPDFRLSHADVVRGGELVFVVK